MERIFYLLASLFVSSCVCSDYVHCIQKAIKSKNKVTFIIKPSIMKRKENKKKNKKHSSTHYIMITNHAKKRLVLMLLFRKIQL